jgi:predicted DNA-binding WGR domain protein
MARGKRTPERSKLVRAQTPAFSRRQRKDGDGGADPEPAEFTPPTAAASEVTQTEIAPLEDPPRAFATTEPVAMVSATIAPAISPRPGAEPWPDATPAPMKPVDPPDGIARPRTETLTATAPFGRPPEMPTTSAPPPLVLGDVENPAHMPSPREVPGGSPDDPAPAPGRVPPGDSRSMRKHDEFALVYRVGTSVITRTGRIGTRGQWRVVEYPTSASASNSYAKECSRFVSEGFSDYRE